MSYKVPGYIDGLPRGITVHDAFEQIRVGAISVVRDLLSVENGGNTLNTYQFNVPGLPLTVTGTVARSTETALVSASMKSQTHPLFRITKGNRTDNLAGFRDREPGGDFSLIEHPDGFVICLLGNTGLNGSGQRGPVGKSRFKFGQEVHRLKGEDLLRFDWVAGGVYRGLQAVREIKAGKDLTKVLKDAGRDIHK